MKRTAVKVAIQGELGSFSHEAAEHMLRGCTVVPCARSVEVFDRVQRGSVAAAVIPIENSLAGTVAEHADLLVARDVFIQGEFLLRIVHNVIAAPGVKLSALRKVLSHPVALDQCRDFFRRYPRIEAVPFYDTAGSVKQLVELRDRSSAGIASAQAAIHYGGEILAAEIEDNPENYTRFFLVRRRQEVAIDTAADKVSLAFTVENRPGTLVAALQIFANQGTNLTKIESRPVHGKPWQYVFYADYQLSTPNSADAAWSMLARHCSMVKELGRYRSGKREG
jgi:prephenate dehydratase